MKLFTLTPTRTVLVAATTASLCASVLVASPANAAAQPEPSSSTLSAETLHQLEAAIDEGTNTFNGASAVAAGVSTTVVDDFATGWAAGGKPVTNAEVDRAELAEIRDAVPIILGCSGKNRWDYTGIQLNVYLNSCNTTRIIGMINTGTGVASLAAAITAFTGLGVAIAGALAGVLGIAGGVLTTCSARGRGIVIHNIPPGPVVWCNGQ